MKRRHDIISYVLINQLIPHPAPGTAFAKVRPLRRDLLIIIKVFFCFQAAVVRENSEQRNAHHDKGVAPGSSSWMGDKEPADDTEVAENP